VAFTQVRLTRLADGAARVHCRHEVLVAEHVDLVFVAIRRVAEQNSGDATAGAGTYGRSNTSTESPVGELRTPPGSGAVVASIRAPSGLQLSG
jgi:hypothetical protein